MKSYDSFTHAYVKILDEVYNQFDYESAPRGEKIREKLNFSFMLTDPRERYPYVYGRKFSLEYVAGELLWYLSANNKVDWIQKYSSVWSKISDDGVTANSAYGYRMFMPIDSANNSQWSLAVDELVRDNDSRRCVIHIRNAFDTVNAKLDVPCTISLQYLLRQNKLHAVVNMRSQDVIWGLANDVPAFTVFQELMAIELSERLGKHIECGNYYHNAASIHIYDRHFKMVESVLSDNRNSVSEIVNCQCPKISTKPDVKDLLEYEKKCADALSKDDIDVLIRSVTQSQQTFWTDLKVLYLNKACKRLNFQLNYDSMLSRSAKLALEVFSS